MYLFDCAAFFIGTESKMKLWDVLATCFLLLSSVATRPLYQNSQPAKKTHFPSSYRDSVEEEDQSVQQEDHNLQEISMEGQCKAHSSFLLIFSAVDWSVRDKFRLDQGFSC